MKYMKLGTRPDTFYTEEATRSVCSEVPSDLTIQVNNTTFLLHKYPLLPKCGLLQRLCSDSNDNNKTPIELHEIPGDEQAFELCAKFCYGITINLSAHNVVPAICAATFLRMVDSVEDGNFFSKLEAFFNSCILHGWKDSIIALQATGKLPTWSENLGIVRKCVDAIVEKILTHPSKVTWSYTYSRRGYAEKHHRSVPKDWWTEDISDLDIDLFQCIISAIRSSKMLPPPLIGEALHVYATRWLLDPSNSKATESSSAQTNTMRRTIVESIVSMIPSDRDSVSFGFLLRLLNVSNSLGVGASPSTKAELVRRAGRKLEEATLTNLLLPSHSPSTAQFYDTELVETILESYLVQFRRRSEEGESMTMRSMRKVSKLIDTYLQVVAGDVNIPVSKIISLAELLPEFARSDHNDLYRAIDVYLQEHPQLSKADKKHLCRILDCTKLSPDVCMHAVRNERLPLRTVVQVLFTEQERATRVSGSRNPPVHDVLTNRGVSNPKVKKLGEDNRTLKPRSKGREIQESIARVDNVGEVERDRLKSDGKMPADSVRKVGKKKLMEIIDEPER